MTAAPLFRSLDQLTGERAGRSGVTAVLDAADKISGQATEHARLVCDNHMLRRQLNALLETDRGELLTRNDELAEELDHVRELLAMKVAECAELLRERDNLRNATAGRSI